MLAVQMTGAPEYEPGACNIGPAEITARRRGGHVALIVAIALLVGLLVIGAPPIARLLVALPVAGAAIGYLQAYFRFCAGFGFRGVFNFGAVGEMTPVADPAALARDRARALRIAAAGGLIGLATGVVLVVLPL